MSKYLKQLRQKIGKDIILMPTTACIIVNDNEEVLLQLRSDSANWGCPGGIMDLNETVTESVTREVNEETGLLITNASLFGIYSGRKYIATYPNGDKVATVQMVFLAKGYRGEMKKDGESNELKFFPLKNLPTEISKFHKEYLDDYASFKSGTLTIPVLK